MTERKTFTDLGVEAALAAALAEQGITHPFPIQELTLPLALQGADIIGQARTGTGKTLGFGLPLLQRIDPTSESTQAIVVVPTRELCIQVADDLAVGAARGVTVQSVYGGVAYEEQTEALSGGVHVVVGTPGRTLDHLQRGNLDLSNVKIVVLDEADEMLDMGFLPDVERLLQGVPDDRQTLLFSATMPTAIVKLARRFMVHPTFMRAEAEEHHTAPTVEQHFFLVHRMDKPRVLARILQSPGRGGAFVFTRTKNMADRLVRELEDLHVSAIAVHGDLRQAMREKNLDRFRDGKADVLVATEVAARGLDVSNVTHVVNYDCPEDDKMYLHRIGRTARAGAKGVAVTFGEFNEIDRLNVIRKAVGAESEILEVFSTSEELTGLFDLPAEKPWDHLVRAATGSRGTSERRKSSTDGRPKSSRSAEGASSRRRSRDDDRPTKPAETRVAAPEARKPQPAEPPSETSADTPRTRTRVRVRDTEPADAGSTPSDRPSSDASGTTRTRARRERTSTETSAERGSGEARQRSSDRTSRSSRERSTTERSTTERSSRSTGERTKRSSGERTSGERTSGERAPRKRSTGERTTSSGRGGRSATTSRAQSSRHDRDRTVRVTRRGEDARGEGTPRPKRRVKVEHLP